MRPAAATVALVALAACGDGAVVVEATPEAVEAARAETESAGTASYEIDVTFHVDGISVEMVGHGQVDFERDLLEERIDLSDATVGNGTISPDLLRDLRGEFRVVVDGPDIYLCTDGVPDVPSGCVESLPGDEAAIAAAGLLNPMGPTQVLGLLSGADSVEHLGTAEVGDVETTHLRTEVVPASIDIPPAEIVPTAYLYDRSGVDPNDPVAIEVWIDRRGRLQQLQAIVDIRLGVVEEPRRVVIRIRFVELGGPVDIEVPDV